MIEHTSTFKQLASWGGFRRHFKEGEGREEEDGHTGADTRWRTSPLEAPLGAPASAIVPEVWKQTLHEQLVAKRAEVQAMQRKLESLSLEQQQLEYLYTSAHAR